MGEQGRGEWDGDAGRGDVERAAGPGPRSRAEWATLGISAVVVTLLVGAALAEIFLRDDPSGARISVEVDVAGAEKRGGMVYVPWTVRNDGEDAGTDIVAVFEISAGGEVVEETTVDIPLLASHDAAQGELVTGLDLGTHTVEGRIGAVREP